MYEFIYIRFNIFQNNTALEIINNLQKLAKRLQPSK